MTTLKAILGFILFVIAAVLLFVYSGIYNVAADEPHSGPVRWLLETTRINSIDRRDDQVNVPLDLAAATRIQKGAASYAAMCQVCHLGPGVEPTPLHQGLNPTPPRLDEEVPHYSPIVCSGSLSTASKCLPCRHGAFLTVIRNCGTLSPSYKSSQN